MEEAGEGRPSRQGEGGEEGGTAALPKQAPRCTSLVGLPAGVLGLCHDSRTCLQAAQAAKRAEEAQDRPAAEGVPQLVDELDDVDPNQYHERRLRGLLAAKAEGRNPYPHKFQVSTYLPAFVARYSGLEAGARLEEIVSVAGEAGLSACFLGKLLHHPTVLA